MKLEYRHGVSAQEAYKRIDGLLTALQGKYSDQIESPDKSWNDSHDRMDFSLKVLGQHISGNLALNGDRAVLDVKLPLLARVYSGRLEKMVVEQLDQLFSTDSE